MKKSSKPLALPVIALFLSGKVYDPKTLRYDQPYATGNCAGEGICGTCFVEVRSFVRETSRLANVRGLRTRWRWWLRPPAFPLAMVAYCTFEIYIYTINRLVFRILQHVLFHPDWQMRHVASQHVKAMGSESIVRQRLLVKPCVRSAMLHAPDPGCRSGATPIFLCGVRYYSRASLLVCPGLICVDDVLRLFLPGTMCAVCPGCGAPPPAQG